MCACMCVLKFLRPINCTGSPERKGGREREGERQTNGQIDRQRILLIDLSPDAKQHVLEPVDILRAPDTGT